MWLPLPEMMKESYAPIKLFLGRSIIFKFGMLVFKDPTRRSFRKLVPTCAENYVLGDITFKFAMYVTINTMN